MIRAWGSQRSAEKDVKIFDSQGFKRCQMASRDVQCTLPVSCFD